MPLLQSLGQKCGNIRPFDINRFFDALPHRFPADNIQIFLDHLPAGCRMVIPPPSAWRRTAMIWASVNLLFFIRTSSLTLPRKFYYRTPSKDGVITISTNSKSFFRVTT